MSVQKILGEFMVLIALITIMALACTWMITHLSDIEPKSRTDWTYEVVVTGTEGDGCPCSYEVWSTSVQVFDDGDDSWIIDENGWHIIYRQNDCTTWNQ